MSKTDRPITVHSDSYAPWGTRMDAPDPPEKTSEQRAAEQKADRIRYTELLAQERWTAAELETAQTFGFPRPLSRVFMQFRSEPVFSRAAIATWKRDLRGFVERMR